MSHFESWGFDEKFVEANCKVNLIPESVTIPMFVSKVADRMENSDVSIELITNAKTNDKKEILQILNEQGGKVILTNISGVGKTAEIMKYLNEYILNIGKEGFPSTFLFRSATSQPVVYLFHWNKEVEKLEVYAFDENDEKRRLGGLENFCADVYRQYPDALLILELSSKERTPICPLPTLVKATLGDVEKDFKGMIKSKASLYLHDLPTLPQCLLYVKCFRHVSQKKDGFFNSFATDEEAYEEMRRRYEEIGGVLYYLCADKEQYSNYVYSLECAIKRVPKELEKLYTRHIPDNISRVCGLKLRAGASSGWFANTVIKPSSAADVAVVENETSCDFFHRVSSQHWQSTHHLAFLSPALAHKTRLQITTLEQVQLMNSHGFSRQIAELMVQEFLKERNLGERGTKQHTSQPAKQQSSRVPNRQWQWYANPGPAKRIAKSISCPAIIAAQRKSKRVVTTLPSMWVNQPVSALLPDVLYRHEMHNGPLYDWLVVDHAHKHVLLIKSVSNKSDGTISINCLNKALDGLHMCVGQICGNYTPVLVALTDTTNNAPREGLGFVANICEPTIIPHTSGSSIERISAKCLREDKRYLGGQPLHTYIARCTLYPTNVV